MSHPGSSSKQYSTTSNAILGLSLDIASADQTAARQSVSQCGLRSSAGVSFLEPMVRRTAASCMSKLARLSIRTFLITHAFIFLQFGGVNQPIVLSSLNDASTTFISTRSNAWTVENHRKNRRISCDVQNDLLSNHLLAILLLAATFKSLASDIFCNSGAQDWLHC